MGDPLVTVSVVVALCLTTIVLAHITRRYHETKREIEYRTARLEYDDMILADGGEDDHE